MMVYELKNIIFFIPIIRNIQHPSAAHKEIYVFAMISKMVDIVQTSNHFYASSLYINGKSKDLQHIIFKY